jgi:hypothetical protein
MDLRFVAEVTQQIILRCLDPNSSLVMDNWPKLITIIENVKIKVKLLLCLTKHHAMKAYWGSGDIAPLILWPRQ